MKALVITQIDVSRSLNQRTHHLIDYLARRFETVTVLRPFFHHEVNTNYTRKTGCLQSIAEGNIRYLAIRPPAPPILHDLARERHLSQFAAECLHEEYDLCLAHAPWSGVLANALKKQGVVEIFIYEDLDFFEGFHTGRGLKRSRRRRDVRRMEQSSLRGADLTVCISRALKELREGQTAKPVIFIPNGVKRELFERGVSATKEQPGLEAGFNLIYSGSLEAWAGLSLAIEAMPALRLRCPPVRLVILGEAFPGSRQEDHLHRMVRERGLEECVYFMGRKDYAELPSFFAGSHIGLATFQPTDLMRYAYPMKVIEYMAAGLPVIAVGIGETERIITESEAGLTIAYAAEAFVEAVSRLYEDHELARRLSQNGREFAADYDWDALFSREMHETNSLLGTRFPT